MNNPQTRLIFVDYAKVIGIYLVIVGHTPIALCLHNFIYSFHIPLFFVISGMLFKSDFQNYPKFLKKRLMQLMVPYVIINLITYLFWLLIGRKFGSDSSIDLSIYKPLLGILYGNGIDNFLIHCTALWFIPCLFIVENIYFFIMRFKIDFVVIIFILLGFIDYYLNLPRLPWGLNLSLVAIGFFGFGQYFKRKLFFHRNVLTTSILVLISLVIAVLLSRINNSVDMNNRIYGNYLIYILCGIAGTVFLLFFSKLLEFFLGERKIITYLSNATIIILGFHSISNSFIKGVLLFVLHMPMSTYDGVTWINCLISFISLLFMIPVIFFFSKYFPIVLGKRQ